MPDDKLIHHMDTFTSFIVALIFGLLITFQFLRSVKKEERNTRHEIQFVSSTIVCLLIFVFLYTDNIALLVMLSIICLPITIYSFHKQYQADKMKIVYSIALLVGIMAIVGTTALL